MKLIKLYLPVVFLVVSCSGPVTFVPAQTSTVEPTAPALITPDPDMGGIEGNISWLDPLISKKIPVKTVNLELNGHSDSHPRYTIKTDPNGNYKFINIEPIKYGFGVYFSIPISERLCDNPEFTFEKDYDWRHYSTALKGELWFDIIFSTKDVEVNPGDVIVLNFVLKCP